MRRRISKISLGGGARGGEEEGAYSVFSIYTRQNVNLHFITSVELYITVTRSYHCTCVDTCVVKRCIKYMRIQEMHLGLFMCCCHDVKLHVYIYFLLCYVVLGYVLNKYDWVFITLPTHTGTGSMERQAL